jgi:hypothetical protein
MNISTRNIAIGALVTAVAAPALVLGGIALSAPGDGGKIDGCYDKSNGLLSVIGGKKLACDLDTELPISWNVQGPQGAQGPQGVPGLPPLPPAIRPEDLQVRRLPRAQRRRARLPISPLKPAALKRRRGGNLPVANAVPIPVGNGGLRVLKAQVSGGRLQDGRSHIRLIGGFGPDSARSATVLQVSDTYITSGRGIVEVVFRTPVAGCTAVASGTRYDTADDVSAYSVGGSGVIFRANSAYAVRVSTTSMYGLTAPFNLILVCDPRDAPPVAQRVVSTTP